MPATAHQEKTEFHSIHEKSVFKKEKVFFYSSKSGNTFLLQLHR